MKVSGQSLGARRALLLAGAMVFAIPGSAALAADAKPVLKAPAAVQDVVGWDFFGDVEVGGRALIQDPPSGFGRAPPPDNWLTPRTTESRARFEEYGEIRPGFFLDHFRIGAGTKDGIYAIQVWSQNAGYNELSSDNLWARDNGWNNQSYYAALSKIGEHYLYVNWDQLPHLISTSAKTLHRGAGGTLLTVDDTLQANLQANARFATTAGATGVTARTNIEGFVNNAATNVTIGTKRDKGTAEYRFTPDPNWEFRVDYSNEHRTGTRPLAINWAYGFGVAPGRPTDFVEVPQPIDDRTQNINASAQYVGTSPWGKRWITNVRYSGSFYENSLKYFEAENPFCLTCLTGAAAANLGPNLLRMPLAPDNMSNAITVTSALDLPWQGRYTSTVQYNMMRQNDPFVNTAINGLAPAPLPGTSLDGKVDTLLMNNVLTTQITKDLKATFRYRYYDFNNQTPERIYTNYVESDSLLGVGPRRNLSIAYTKQNAGAEVNWRMAKGVNIGAAYTWEQWDRSRRDVNVTNEHGGKFFADAELWGDSKARGSVSYSQRRYNRYDA